MIYEYNTEYTKKQSATCYHEDLNSTGKIKLSFNTSLVCQISVILRLWRWLQNPKVVSSSLAVGKKNSSFCKSPFRSLQLKEAHASEINHDIHLVNTLFQIKNRQKNMAAVCSGISLFMLALSIPRCNSSRRYSVSYTQ